MVNIIPHLFLFSDENADGLEPHKGALYKRKDFLDVEEEG